MTPIAQALVTALQHHQSGRHPEAEALCRQVLVLEPTNTDALGLLAVVRQALGRVDEAILIFQEALRLKPYLVDVQNNLGHAYLAQGNIEAATRHLQQALFIKPDSPHALVNLGNARKQQGRFDEAVANYERALNYAPNFVEAMINLGNTYLRVGKVDEAVAYHRRAVALKPESTGAQFGLAAGLKAQGNIHDALAVYREVLRFKRDYPEAHMNQGLTLLLLGDFENGLPEYEWRWKCRDLAPARFGKPLWDGSPLGERTILLHAEQGFGDGLQFIRYAPLVKERGGTVIVECLPALSRLLATCPGVDRVIPRREPLPPFDVEIPLLTLPSIFGTTLATVPATVPYLFPEEQRIEKWRAELSPIRKFKVGINWQGNPQNSNDPLRSVPLAHFAALKEVEGVQLISLQKSHGRDQLPGLAERLDLMDLGARTEDDFMDTAALMKALDLIVTSDTSVAHLAGALGVPVWVALSFTADWRWLLAREDCPWYPTMRLFRQPKLGDWASVFARIREALDDLASRERQRPEGPPT